MLGLNFPFARVTSRKYINKFSSGKVPRVLIAVANGSEEIETMTAIDILRRGNVEVTIATVHKLEDPVVLSRRVKILAEAVVKECSHRSWDMIVLPGGGDGARNMHECAALSEILATQNKSKKFIAAICASPAVVLAPLQILTGKRATCYPLTKFTDQIESYVADESVVVDGHVITAQGPGSSIPFSLKLVELLMGKEEAEKVKAALVWGV